MSKFFGNPAEEVVLWRRNVLYLNRRVGDRVIIKMGTYKVTMTVVAINDGTVQLGFRAPQVVRIDREERLSDSFDKTDQNEVQD